MVRMVGVVKTLFEAKAGEKAIVSTETDEQKSERRRRANERAGRVFGLTTAQERVLKKARTAR